MATDSITDNVRDDASDLIDHFKLDATYSPDHTLQISWERSPVPGSRKVKVETRWYRGDNIGHGAFGAVWVERNNSDASASTVSRAVKEVSKAYMKSREIDVRRELLALAILSKHPDEFVQFLGWFENKSILYLTMEYMPLGDLTPFVEKGIPEQEVKAITLQLLEGLSLMHKHSLAHRDLKPANVFVKSASPQWFVKIGDFGIAKRCRGDSTALQTEVGTQGYLAPEIAVESNEQYTNACDIWSLGCVVYKALTQILPFPRYRDLNSFCSGKPFPVSPLSSKNISFSGVSFLEKLLAVDPIARLTAELALECDWLMVSECPPQSAADLEYQEEKSSANTLILRVVPEYAQESAAAGLGKQEEERVHGIGAVPEYSPQSSTDLENQEEWYRFQNLCDRGVNIVRLGVSGRYNDEYFFLDSTDSDNSRHLRHEIKDEQSDFYNEMKTNGGGIEGLASEGHPEIKYPIELLKRVYGDRLLPFQMMDPKLLFQAHSKPWFDLAVRHVDRCFEHCVKFLGSILVVFLAEDFRSLLAQLFYRYLVKPLVRLYSQALHELKQITMDSMRISNTKSEEHMKELIRLREEKSNRKLLDLIQKNKDPNVEMSTRMSNVARSEWIQYEAKEFIEQMLVYYNTEQERFINNVGVQVVERHLLDPLATLFRDATKISRVEFYALYNEREREELDKGMEKLEITAESL